MMAEAVFSCVLLDSALSLDVGDWSVEGAQLGLPEVPVKISKHRLHGGKQQGVDLLTLENGEMQISLIPTRGMSIYEVRCDGYRLGWQSPVKEVVNPAFINAEQRGGKGWLDGFNEMLVRCGFEWAGHPCEEDGVLYTLHGRAANLPASRVTVEIDLAPPYAIRVVALVRESTFKCCDLELQTTLTLEPGSRDFHIHDRLTNLGDYNQPFQLIYHGNYSSPFLEQDAQFLAPVKRVTPFNQRACEGLAQWHCYAGPTAGFDEEVFLLECYADEQHRTLALVHNAAADLGVSLAYRTDQLPYLTLWKNTDTVRQGYVTGVEPGTCYPYPRPFEREQGRLAVLATGASREFELTYGLLMDEQEVGIARQQVEAIQNGHPCEVITHPPRAGS
ncbi:hypothetical protein WH50_00545 [Pokkaliibacter plantistimulans]|uniref:Thioredoxin n=1 Tax=Pokkaliibacter plantistimulans TaxID=1635171 RepID=A0ABX5M2B5_9GAMM|nr:aldose 1-epimerase family protein [Pokkaliibacter plantistimulans]PXF33056.1 hypothetical protein WH50_00545 [Pokkaliibacter plantistimulans]